MRRTPYLLLSVFVTVVVLLLVAACHRETEEDKVRKVISAVQQSAEDKKVLPVLEHVSKTYQDPQGNDYDGIKGLVAFYFFRHRKVGVLIPNIDVTVKGDEALAVFQAILSGKGTGEEAPGGLLPEALGAYDFEVICKKEQGQWKVTSAKWRRAGEALGQQ
jgi:hypothetical protein